MEGRELYQCPSTLTREEGEGAQTPGPAEKASARLLREGQPFPPADEFTLTGEARDSDDGCWGPGLFIAQTSLPSPL